MRALCSCTGELGCSVRSQQPQGLHHLRARNQTEGSGQDCGDPAAIQLQGGAEYFPGAQLSQGSAPH